MNRAKVTMATNKLNYPYNSIDVPLMAHMLFLKIFMLHPVIITGDSSGWLELGRKLVPGYITNKQANWYSPVVQ